MKRESECRGCLWKVLKIHVDYKVKRKRDRIILIVYVTHGTNKFKQEFELDRSALN
jgi:hypothetical protein